MPFGLIVRKTHKRESPRGNSNSEFSPHLPARSPDTQACSPTSPSPWPSPRWGPASGWSVMGHPQEEASILEVLMTRAAEASSPACVLPKSTCDCVLIVFPKIWDISPRQVRGAPRACWHSPCLQHAPSYREAGRQTDELLVFSANPPAKHQHGLPGAVEASGPSSSLRILQTQFLSHPLGPNMSMSLYLAPPWPTLAFLLADPPSFLDADGTFSPFFTQQLECLWKPHWVQSYQV